MPERLALAGALRQQQPEPDPSAMILSTRNRSAGSLLAERKEDLTNDHLEDQHVWRQGPDLTGTSCSPVAHTCPCGCGRTRPRRRNPPSRSSYETLGYVIAGRAELTIEGTNVTLEPGDSYLVPSPMPNTPTAFSSRSPRWRPILAGDEELNRPTGRRAFKAT